MFTDSDTLIPKNYDRLLGMVVLNNDHTQTLSLETDEINMDKDYLDRWIDVKDSVTEKLLGGLRVKTAKNAKYIRGVEIVVEPLTVNLKALTSNLLNGLTNNLKVFVSNEQIIQYSYKKRISFGNCYYTITIYI